MNALVERYNDFAGLGAEIVALSTDTIESHQSWVQREIPKVRFPVLSDATQQISRDYGVLIEERGVSMRATFIIDPARTIQYISINAELVGRSVDDPLRTLQALQTGELCPANWRPGQAPL